MKLLSLSLLVTTGLWATTTNAQSVQIGSAATPIAAIGHTAAINTGTSLTLNGGGNISVTSGGNLNLSAGSLPGFSGGTSPGSIGGTISLRSPTIAIPSPPSPAGGPASLTSQGALRTAPGGIISVTSTPPAITSRGTISVTSTPPAITSRGTISVTSAPPAQTGPQATPQGVVPVAMPIASAGGLANGAVTVRMPLVNASAIKVR